MINIVRFDDWIQVFVDDFLEYEGHSVDPITLMEICRVDYSYTFIDEWDNDKMPYRNFSEYKN